MEVKLISDGKEIMCSNVKFNNKINNYNTLSFNYHNNYPNYNNNLKLFDEIDLYIDGELINTFIVKTFSPDLITGDISVECYDKTTFNLKTSYIDMSIPNIKFNSDIKYVVENNVIVDGVPKSKVYIECELPTNTTKTYYIVYNDLDTQINNFNLEEFIEVDGVDDIVEELEVDTPLYKLTLSNNTINNVTKKVYFYVSDYELPDKLQFLDFDFLLKYNGFYNLHKYYDDINKKLLIKDSIPPKTHKQYYLCLNNTLESDEGDIFKRYIVTYDVTVNGDGYIKINNPFGHNKIEIYDTIGDNYYCDDYYIYLLRSSGGIIFSILETDNPSYSLNIEQYNEVYYTTNSVNASSYFKTYNINDYIDNKLSVVDSKVFNENNLYITVYNDNDFTIPYIYIDFESDKKIYVSKTNKYDYNEIIYNIKTKQNLDITYNYKDFSKYYFKSNDIKNKKCYDVINEICGICNEYFYSKNNKLFIESNNNNSKLLDIDDSIYNVNLDYNLSNYYNYVTVIGGVDDNGNVLSYIYYDNNEINKYGKIQYTYIDTSLKNYEELVLKAKYLLYTGISNMCSGSIGVYDSYNYNVGDSITFKYNDIDLNLTIYNINFYLDNIHNDLKFMNLTLNENNDYLRMVIKNYDDRLKVLEEKNVVSDLNITVDNISNINIESEIDTLLNETLSNLYDATDSYYGKSVFW